MQTGQPGGGLQLLLDFPLSSGHVVSSVVGSCPAVLVSKWSQRRGPSCSGPPVPLYPVTHRSPAASTGTLINSPWLLQAAFAHMHRILLLKLGSVCSSTCLAYQELSVIEHTCKSSPEEVEAGKSDHLNLVESLRPARSTPSQTNKQTKGQTNRHTLPATFKCRVLPWRLWELASGPTLDAINGRSGPLCKAVLVSLFLSPSHTVDVSSR